jgi:hypothetical protein
MANEAAVTIVLRMRDEASSQMGQFSQRLQKSQYETLRMNVALSAMGSALVAVGNLVGKVDDPLAKMVSTFLNTGGAILTTTAAIVHMIPYIQQLIAYFRTLAVTQGIVKALSGPVGWAALGVAAGAAGGIALATRGGGNQTSTTIVNNNAGSVITERELGEISRREIIKTQDRNSGSGIKQ